MPNSKFFVGSYSGDVTNRNANYTSCDWSSAVSTAYQSPISSPVVGTCGRYQEPTNPYIYAKQPCATSSNYYAPQPIAGEYTDSSDYPVYPEMPVCTVPSTSHASCSCQSESLPEPIIFHCHCNYPQEEPCLPECPVVPDSCECPEEPVVPDYPSCNCQPNIPDVPACPPEPVLPDNSSCNCQLDIPELPECPPEPMCSAPQPCPCNATITAYSDEETVVPAMTPEALAYANRRPRRRNRIASVMTRMQSGALDAITDCHTAVTPMPKRKHCACHCVPETPVAQNSCSCAQGRYIDTPEEDDCKSRKREKCFLYEKLKRYHRKGKSLCDFLNDYDEETFYALIGD